jgi:hypothetical protein
MKEHGPHKTCCATFIIIQNFTKIWRITQKLKHIQTAILAILFNQPFNAQCITSKYSQSVTSSLYTQKCKESATLRGGESTPLNKNPKTAFV